MQNTYAITGFYNNKSTPEVRYSRGETPHIAVSNLVNVLGDFGLLSIASKADIEATLNDINEWERAQNEHH